MTPADAPPTRPKEEKCAADDKPVCEKKNAPRLPMVGWYDPRQLFKTGIEVAISTVFGRHSDFRIVEALSSDPTEIYNYAVHYNDDLHDTCKPDPSRPRDSIWIDYVGDVGDGWNSTYAVAYHLAQPEHAFEYRDPKTGAARQWETKRGDVLVFGGDQVYPTASRLSYEQRLLGPYETALPRVTAPPAPHVYAIPGNHDWYDSLVSFTRLFAPGRWIGGWRTQQSRSYFALKLPQGWWLLGTDFQLASDIDAQQVNYFKYVSALMCEVEKRTGEPQRVILCHAEPHWIRAAMYEGIDPGYNESNLLFLEDMLGGRVAAFIAGDLHHYRRHEADDCVGLTQKITAGGGGAFLHPTHYGLLGKSLEEIRQPPSKETPERAFCLKACFPPKDVSSRLCWRNLIFPYLKGNASRTFGLVTAALYLLTALSVLGRVGDADMSDMRYEPWMLTATALAAVLNNHLTLLWVLLIVVGFVFFTDTHSKPYRVLMGGGHGLAHVLAAFGVALVSASFVTQISERSWVWGFPLGGRLFTLDWRVVLAGALIMLGGFVFGSLLMGLYLLISLNLFGRHSNEAFSSISVEDWKNFLRLHIDERGTLTIYPIGFPSVPRKWSDSTAPDGPQVLPDGPDAPRPELIEPPIVIDKARTKKGTAAG
ncbi:MAG TPA: metallophosphoesterase [Pyrinomonadaceae bacterium]